MAEPLPKQALDSATDPSEIVQQSFDLERRGFDQRQVQSYLRAVADSLQDAQQREADMRARLGKAIRRAETAEKAVRETPSTDPSELTRQIGDEVTSVLDAARAAGEQRVAAAEKSAERLMANAKGEATQIRGAAETIMDKRRGEADAAAKQIVTKGQTEAEAIRQKAKADADEMLADAADRVAQARDECDGLIREAEEARGQILEDMERRRRQARAQVERLRVGRDRLLRSYDVVRRTLEETTVELKLSLQEAKVKGDTAARLVSAEPLAERAQLESELADAKLIGTVRVSEAKVLNSPALPRRIDPPQVPNIDLRTESAPKQRKPKVNAPKTESKPVPPQPQAPAVAPILKPAAAAQVESPETAAPTNKSRDAADVDAPDLDAPDLDAVDVDAAELDAAELDAADLDDELAQLEDDNLDVVELSDEIEEVVALALVPDTSDPDAAQTEAAQAEAVDTEVAGVKDDTASAGPSLFAALRAQRDAGAEPIAAPSEPAPAASETGVDAVAEVAAAQASATDEVATDAVATDAAEPVADEPVTDEAADEVAVERAAEESAVDDVAAQRDAIIAESATQLERRLKRALADEQNELLAGIRGAKHKQVSLTSIVGDIDGHVNRYVIAINEMAVVAYGAGAALVDATPRTGELPAGAVEELLAADVVEPIRAQLASLDELDVDSAESHLDPVRAFYRQRKTDHLGHAASRLAQLLCVSGVCDALPVDASLPWEPAS